MIIYGETSIKALLAVVDSMGLFVFFQVY